MAVTILTKDRDLLAVELCQVIDRLKCVGTAQDLTQEGIPSILPPNIPRVPDQSPQFLRTPGLPRDLLFLVTILGTMSNILEQDSAMLRRILIRSCTDAGCQTQILVQKTPRIRQVLTSLIAKTSLTPQSTITTMSSTQGHVIHLRLVL